MRTMSSTRRILASRSALGTLCISSPNATFSATPGHVGLADADTARGRCDETGDHAQRGGLAAAAGAQERHQLALGDLQ
ncbi:hypothetical protein G6F63_016327 [Rhizopus arrhizus]|nr:hypothetical protein G6F63_016327 [Rhizopus arrhizus]